MNPRCSTIVFAAALTVSNPPYAQDDVPPVGRSRFDQLIGTAPVPYPFSSLVDTINRQMQPDSGDLPPLKITLIPLGRSLQRDAGAPAYFRFPRVVAAADGANRPGYAPLKDRLFLGYHEQGRVLEVISYNDTAGRFEFQVVRDYHAGGTPQVFYARRSLCLACHQNAAPIFSRPLWDETTANPDIARRLRETGRDFYGIRLTGTDVAYFIDTATDRANRFAVWQMLWQQGCGQGEAGDRCRGAAFVAALDYASIGKLPARDGLPTLARNWKTLWPGGLPIPNPDLPNRDPLAALADAAHDPLLLRPPLETWHVPDTTAFIVGLAGMLDIAATKKLPRHAVSAAVAALRIRGELGAKPFGPSLLDALLVELGMPPTTARAELPRARAEPRSHANGAYAQFRNHCGQCHDTAISFPPNFLHGDDARVAATLDHCAERIFYRLSLWDTPMTQRGKTPMPPLSALAARGIDASTWMHSPALAALRDDVRGRIRAQGGQPDDIPARNFEQLRACLPAASAP